MKTATAPTLHQRPLLRTERLRQRADLPAIRPAAPFAIASRAEHDFLVPNPRPDLTLDRTTLRMIEAG
ncbi:MAG: hypothetical protein V4773_14325 [Verrucomicrobiota bacterium]